jgi:manganese oxidase
MYQPERDPSSRSYYVTSRQQGALRSVDPIPHETGLGRPGGAWTISVAGFVLAAVVVGMVTVAALLGTSSADAGDAVAAPVPEGPVAVELSDFAIDMSAATVASGEIAFEVSNVGAAPHDLKIDGVDGAQTPMLESGDSASLTVDLDPGTYSVICDVPGHAGIGMTTELTVVAADETVTAGEGPSSNDPAMTNDEIDAMMAERTLAFPAETEGEGAVELEPTVLPDGTKEWELTTSIVDWEVEPGRVVEGWAYNGMIPGPTLRADVGDDVRIVLHNELPESTAIHFHGLRTPNAMDGVPDITQPVVKPGESYVYEFEIVEPAVGMYHSHHHADKQIPNGLAGAFIAGEIPLPDGVEVSQELPMMINDAGTIGMSLNGKSFPATRPIVVEEGDHILVHYMNEGYQIHPMHLHGIHQLVVAKDGFPLAEPQYMDTVNVAPGERWTVLIEADVPGVWAWHCHILTHAEGSEGMFGMVTALVVNEAP